MLERLRVLAGIVVDELELRRANRALAQRREQLERAETEIAASEARYRQLAEHSSDLTVRLDLSDARQIITYASPGCRRLGWAAPRTSSAGLAPNSSIPTISIGRRRAARPWRRARR